MPAVGARRGATCGAGRIPLTTRARRRSHGRAAANRGRRATDRRPRAGRPRARRRPIRAAGGDTPFLIRAGAYSSVPEPPRPPTSQAFRRGRGAPRGDDHGARPPQASKDQGQGVTRMARLCPKRGIPGPALRGWHPWPRVQGVPRLRMEAPAHGPASIPYSGHNPILPINGGLQARVAIQIAKSYKQDRMADGRAAGGRAPAAGQASGAAPQRPGARRGPDKAPLGRAGRTPPMHDRGTLRPGPPRPLLRRAQSAAFLPPSCQQWTSCPPRSGRGWEPSTTPRRTAPAGEGRPCRCP